MHVSFTGAGRDALDQALSRAPDHWRPLFKAVRDDGCGLVVIAQGRDRFDLPTDRPQIVVLGDDLVAALGPSAFHAQSLRRYLRRCDAAVIVACQPITGLYAGAALRAVEGRRDVVIVETRPEREGEWLDLIRSACPQEVAIGVGTVKPAGNA